MTSDVGSRCLRRIDHVRTIRPAPPSRPLLPSIPDRLAHPLPPDPIDHTLPNHRPPNWGFDLGCLRRKGAGIKRNMHVGAISRGGLPVSADPKDPRQRRGAHFLPRVAVLPSIYVRTTYVFRGRGRLDEACGRTRPQVGAVVADLGGLFEIRWGIDMNAAACRPWCQHQGVACPLYRFSQAIG